jgi:hypothetical protein
VEPAPPANGTEQEFHYNLVTACDGIVHRLSTSGSAPPCGTISAVAFATSSACPD